MEDQNASSQCGVDAIPVDSIPVCSYMMGWESGEKGGVSHGC